MTRTRTGYDVRAMWSAEAIRKRWREGAGDWRPEVCARFREETALLEAEYLQALADEEARLWAAYEVLCDRRCTLRIDAATARQHSVEADCVDRLIDAIHAVIHSLVAERRTLLPM